ncbi:MAG: hypothetical protein Q4F05_12965 [bacterium]|nr:hypothetical protein [bacterium]
MTVCIQIIAAVLAIILVMILHELPKAIVANLLKTETESFASIFHVARYIDPIGLIFCIAAGAGFSKSYRYKINSKRQPLVIGLTGLASLLVTFLVTMIIYNCMYQGVEIQEILQSGYGELQFAYWFIAFILLNSLGMFFVNLMPIAAFDMGMIVAGISLPHYIAMIRRDTEMKIVLFIVLCLQAIPITVIRIVNLI